MTDGGARRVRSPGSTHGQREAIGRQNRVMSAPTFALPETCLVCATPFSPGDRFCGACGALLPEMPVAEASNDLDFERLFTHQGRIGRLEFLVTAIVLSLFLVIALGLLAAMSGNILGVVLGALLTGAAGFALACATIKRLHDFDTTGWLAALALIPLLGWVFILVVALIGPSTGRNRYGLPNDGSLRPVPV
jgi:uncharacterized membrane protein YhaH (DUF805 family)